MVLSLKDRLIYNIKDNKMKLSQHHKTKIEIMLDEIEYVIEDMEQQEYITFDLEKDLRRLSAMIDSVRQEIEKI